MCAVNIFDLNSTGCYKTFIEAKGHFCQFFLRNGSLFVADDPELSIATTSPPPAATLSSFLAAGDSLAFTLVYCTVFGLTLLYITVKVARKYHDRYVQFLLYKGIVPVELWCMKTVQDPKISLLN